MNLSPEARAIETEVLKPQQDDIRRHKGNFWQTLKWSLTGIASFTVLAGAGVALLPLYEPYLPDALDQISSPLEALHYSTRAKLRTWTATQLGLSTISPKLLSAMQAVIDAEQTEDRARTSSPSTESWQRVVDKYQEAINFLETQGKLSQDEQQNQFIDRYLNHLNHRYQQAQDELQYQHALQTAKGASNLHATAKKSPRQTEAAWNQIIAQWDTAIQQLTALGGSYRQADVQSKLAHWKSLRQQAVSQRDRLIQQSAI